MTAAYGVNGFKRGTFQSLGADPSQLTGTPGDIWVTTDGDHNIYLAVAAPDPGIPGASAPQNQKVPRIFRRGSVLIKSGPSSQLPALATVGAVLLTTDSLVALLGLGPGQAPLRVNLDVSKILASGLVSQQFSSTDVALGAPPAGAQVPVQLFDLNG